MLRNSFYTLKKSKTEDSDNFYFEISLNPDHEIFSGHFPVQAVVPGVVSMQIIKELLEDAIFEKLQLRKSSNTKFLAVISPKNNPELQIEINLKSREKEMFKISAQIKDESTIFLKFTGVYINALSKKNGF